MGKKSILLRIDDRLAAELRAWAAQSLRSMNGQIEWCLREALAQRRRRVPAEGERTEGDAIRGR